jgi:cell surface protein SprA
MRPDEYYVSEYAGMICFKNFQLENYHAGIVYSTANGKHYGYSSNPLDTIILKLFKVNDQSPDDTPLAWELKLKNIYRLPVGNIDPNNFSLDILYRVDPFNGTFILRPGSNPRTFLNIFHLTHTYDDYFNFVAGKTIIPETGDIIFPSLRPFYDDFIAAGVDSTFQYRELYRHSKPLAAQAPIAGKYEINGYAKSAR